MLCVIFKTHIFLSWEHNLTLTSPGSLYSIWLSPGSNTTIPHPGKAGSCCPLFTSSLSASLLFFPASFTKPPATAPASLYLCLPLLLGIKKHSDSFIILEFAR